MRISSAIRFPLVCPSARSSPAVANVNGTRSAARAPGDSPSARICPSPTEKYIFVASGLPAPLRALIRIALLW